MTSQNDAPRLGILAEDPYLRSERNLRAYAELGYDVRDGSDWRDWDADTLLQRIREVDVALTGRRSPRMPDELIADRGRLQWLCHLHGTVRHLVRREHIEAGLAVTNWGDAYKPVIEGTVALLLCQLKQLPGLDAYAKTGVDRRIPHDFRPRLPELTVGMYGFGPIGRQVEKLLRPFGPEVAIHDPYAEDVPPHVRVCGSLEELFDTSQAVIIICGLNAETRDSVDRDLLARLPQGGVVVNVARGPVVVEEDLAELVAAGRLLAACDVIRNEGDWPGSPLAKLDGALLSRHRAGGGKDLPEQRRMDLPLPAFALENLQAFREGGTLKHTISAEEYDRKT